MKKLDVSDVRLLLADHFYPDEFYSAELNQKSDEELLKTDICRDFSFDSLDCMNMLVSVFQKHGIWVGFSAMYKSAFSKKPTIENFIKMVNEFRVTTMKKIFYVFRHGETELNAKKVWQGTASNPDLNNRGCKQATELGQKLMHCGIEKIYSSPFLRAKHTAEIANKQLQVPLELEEALHECCFGEAEGHTMDEINAKWPQLMHDILYPTPTTWDSKYPGDGSESKHQVFNRVNDVLLKIAHTSSCRKIGISTHGGVMSSLLAGLESYGLGLPNCCIAQVDYDPNTDKLSFIKML